MSHSRPWRGRGGSRHVGLLRTRAAKILSLGLGFEVLPDEIKPASGRWRTDWRMDVYRWELFTYQDRNENRPMVCGCWETLTEFVRKASKFGFEVNNDQEIWANEGSRKG